MNTLWPGKERHAILQNSVFRKGTLFSWLDSVIAALRTQHGGGQVPQELPRAYQTRMKKWPKRGGLEFRPWGISRPVQHPPSTRP